MLLNVSKIQNEPIPVPASNPAFKGNNGAKNLKQLPPKLKTDYASIINSSTFSAVVFAVLMGLAVFGWVSGCTHKQDGKEENKTETPAKLPNTSANTINIDA